MDFSSFFIDDDGDPMTMTATYSFNGEEEKAIPGGIFTYQSLFMIEVNPKSPANVGTYKITLTVSDSALSVSSSFVLTVPNTPPRLIATLPN